MDIINSSNSNTNGATGNGSTASITKATTPPPVPATPIPPGNAKAAIGFLTRDTDAEFMADTDRITTSMAGNKAFVSPDPTLAELTAARIAFGTGVSAAKDNRIALSVRVQRRAILARLLRRLAHYVDVTSAGDLPTLLTSGFKAQRGRTPVGALSAPVNLRLVRGKFSGQAIARCPKVIGAGAYQWRCAPAATPGAWSPVVTTMAAHTLFEGLAVGTSYLAQVCVVGTAGTSDWSEAAVVTVL